MAGKVMFGEITDFLKDSFFEENTTGWLFLADRTYKIEWFACVETSAYDKYFYAISPNEDQQTRQERLDHIQEIATQYRDLVVTPEDQIIALSTCLDSTTDGRAILIGRLRAVEEGVT
jgi:sortase B